MGIFTLIWNNSHNAWVFPKYLALHPAMGYHMGVYPWRDYHAVRKEG
jgi:hypothetical protein